MEDRDKTNEQLAEELEELAEELEELQQEVERLKVQEIAYEAQTELLRTLVSMGDKPSPSLILRSLAQQALRICNRLTGAEEGSLFFLDNDGLVSECVLARGAVIKERKDSLTGRVLEKGLAGWVYQKHQVGLITDTMRDERWLQLPSQPYDVRSALCVPILRGKRLLGLITLTHSQPGYFRYEAARLMQTTTTQIGLIVEVLRNYATINQPENSDRDKARRDRTEAKSADRTLSNPSKTPTTFIAGDRSPTANQTNDATEMTNEAELEAADRTPPTTSELPSPLSASDGSTAPDPEAPPRSPLPTSSPPLTPHVSLTTQASEPSQRSRSPQSALPDLSTNASTTAEHALPPHALPPPKPRPIDPSSPILRDNALSRLGLYIVTWDGKFIYANNHLARTFGYRLHEISALSTIFALVTESHYDFVAEKLYQCVRGQIGQLSCRFQGKRKDGKVVQVEIYGARTQFYGKSVTIGVLRALPKSPPKSSLPKSSVSSP